MIEVYDLVQLLNKYNINGYKLLKKNSYIVKENLSFFLIKIDTLK